MSDPNGAVFIDVADKEITLDDVAQRLDIIGQQLNWLTENMQSLFTFVNQVGQNGGGIRGLMSLLKQGPPQLQQQETSNVDG